MLIIFTGIITCGDEGKNGVLPQKQIYVHCAVEKENGKKRSGQL